ncbi:hypothetical protein QYE76_066389 [Lolium multiflorum]|uniref:Hflx-type G domain-containing protein n=1 Tax=Lolium multiflorum TaxID=4521 RepID=A0AAD8SAR3_LOLMU|nr:hypothetical protein QYE76_066389 [Lolium multiflorum]
MASVTKNQFGFMPGRSTMEATFLVRQLMERYKEQKKDLYMVLIDLEKAYDKIPRHVMWWALEKHKVLAKYITLIKDMYDNVVTSVRTRDGDTDDFPIKIGLHQGSALSPYLFDLVMDEVTRDIQGDIPWCMLFAHEEEEVSLDGQVVPQKDTFQYLGSILNKDGDIDDVNHRIKAGWLSNPNPRTYIGSGKVAEIRSAIQALDIETVIFDDELSAGQLRNLEKSFGGGVRVCDRTALILDIFNQRAATHEASLQVTLAQMEYQLPRLTKMWTHLERQSGGQVKGMGEKQIEVDKRILRTQISTLKKELESVRKHRKLYRNRRQSVPIPVVSLVGYTNAGKSTLLNRLTGADVLAEDKLFATLDPTTRRVLMKNGTEFLLTDTVGFIQKLPTMLVAAFRATLEEISESSIIVHLVDISHPLAQQQIDAVDKVLKELDIDSITKLVVWNKIDNTDDPVKVKEEAEKQGIICISAMNGDGLEEFCNAIQSKLKDSLVPIEAFVPYDKGELLNDIHKVGMVERTEYMENGTFIKAHVPLPLARLLTPLRQQVAGAL